MFTLTLVDFEYESCVSIWEFEMMIVLEMIVLPSLQLATRLYSQNTKETEFLMDPDTLICIWILVFPISIIDVSTTRKWSILHYFSSLQDYGPPSIWNSLVHTSWGEMERCEKRAFQLFKMRKNKSAET